MSPKRDGDVVRVDVVRRDGTSHSFREEPREDQLDGAPVRETREAGVEAHVAMRERVRRAGLLP